VKVGRVVWPEGTEHACSRFAASGSQNQCHACGHAIRNAFNWVPLVVENAEGVPHALWVGRDCAENLFGIKATGELEYAGESLPPARAAGA
jgi:hypothetical protein